MMSNPDCTDLPNTAKINGRLAHAARLAAPVVVAAGEGQSAGKPRIGVAVSIPVYDLLRLHPRSPSVVRREWMGRDRRGDRARVGVIRIVLIRSIRRQGAANDHTGQKETPVTLCVQSNHEWFSLLLVV